MNGTAAGALGLFQHHDFFARLCNPTGGNHTGTACANDDCIGFQFFRLVGLHRLGGILGIVNGPHGTFFHTLAAADALLLVNPGLLTVIIGRAYGTGTVAVGTAAAVLIYN